MVLHGQGCSQLSQKGKGKGLSALSVSLRLLHRRSPWGSADLPQISLRKCLLPLLYLQTAAAAAPWLAASLFVCPALKALLPGSCPWAVPCAGRGLQGRAEPPGLGWALGALAGTSLGSRETAANRHKGRQQRARATLGIPPCPAAQGKGEEFSKIVLKLEP